MITFKYKKEKSRQGKTILRPVAEILMENGANSVEVSMYIDSGADISLVPLSVGIALGFSKKAEEINEIKGIAGEAVPYIIKEVIFTLPGYKFKARIGWTLIEEVPLLLGRLDVFPRFKIIFDESDKSVTFIPKR
jgi:hypothetical protein